MKARIKVENALRKGTYFIGREEIDNQYYKTSSSEQVKHCIKDISVNGDLAIDSSTETLSLVTLESPFTNYCESRSNYEECDAKTEAECNTNMKCNLSGGKCLPKYVAANGNLFFEKIHKK